MTCLSTTGVDACVTGLSTTGVDAGVLSWSGSGSVPCSAVKGGTSFAAGREVGRARRGPPLAVSFSFCPSPLPGLQSRLGSGGGVGRSRLNLGGGWVAAGRRPGFCRTRAWSRAGVSAVFVCGFSLARGTSVRLVQVAAAGPQFGMERYLSCRDAAPGCGAHYCRGEGTFRSTRLPFSNLAELFLVTVSFGMVSKTLF